MVHYPISTYCNGEEIMGKAFRNWKLVSCGI